MPCYAPIPSYQGGPGEKVRLWAPLGSENLQLPCGKCLGCRSARALQWAHRCGHEAAQWPHNTFLTLTYADENLPENGWLRPRDLQLFIKRLRKRADGDRRAIHRDGRSGVRYLACGEYGDTNGRPHYHLQLFNCGFDGQQKVGPDLYECDTLRELWPDGLARFGPATAASANYIAQYTLKKQGAGDFDKDGVWRPAPFLRMSLKPAIGTEWLKKHHKDLQNGFLVTREGARAAIPRTYLEKLKTLQPEYREEILARKEQHRMNTPTDRNSPDRLRDAEQIHKRRKQLTEDRSL